MAACALLGASGALDTQARAAELTASGDVSAAAQVDSNPARLFGDSSVVDEAAALTGALNLDLRGETYRAAAEYDVGGRAFLPSAPLAEESAAQGMNEGPDSVTQQLLVEGVKDVGGAWDFGVHGAARDRRGNHAYTDLRGGAEASVSLGPRWSLLLDASVERFLFYESFAYSYHGPSVRGLARYQRSRRHGFVADATYQPRVYNGCAYGEGRLDCAGVRHDAVASAGLEYHYRGAFLLDAGYRFTRQDSSSVGESNVQNRVYVTAGVRLPWDVTALTQGVLQLAHYPQNFGLTDVLLREDEENASSVSFKLVRPLSASVDLELRYAFYGATLAEQGFNYQRHLAGLGVSYRF